jgi:hypothetical protein
MNATSSASVPTTRGVDPLSGVEVELFHPRRQRWSDHFAWSTDYLTLKGKTPTGWATIEVLRLNGSRYRAQRRLLRLAMEAGGRTWPQLLQSCRIVGVGTRDDPEPRALPFLERQAQRRRSTKQIVDATSVMRESAQSARTLFGSSSSRLSGCNPHSFSHCANRPYSAGPNGFGEPGAALPRRAVSSKTAWASKSAILISGRRGGERDWPHGHNTRASPQRRDHGLRYFNDMQLDRQHVR